jgi:hypothetical protein
MAAAFNRTATDRKDDSSDDAAVDENANRLSHELSERRYFDVHARSFDIEDMAQSSNRSRSSRITPFKARKRRFRSSGVY